MIEATHINQRVHYGDDVLEILHDVSLVVDTGETLAVTGPSGSGKTTLLGLLAGLDVPTSGSIVIDGCDITQMDEDQRALFRGQHVGFVFQSFHLLHSLTALENVALPLDLAGVPDATARAKAYLQQVGLGQRMAHFPSRLSGGEQQRVAIARAFASRPQYLFADEPTGNLDGNTGALIIDLLFELNRQHNTTLILVTHEQRLAERCGRQVVIEQGVLTEVPAGLRA